MPKGSGPYNSMSIGETSNIPVAAAIANAVDDAVGVRIKSLPISPERVLEILNQRGWVFTSGKVEPDSRDSPIELQIIPHRLEVTSIIGFARISTPSFPLSLSDVNRPLVYGAVLNYLNRGVRGPQTSETQIQSSLATPVIYRTGRQRLSPRTTLNHLC